MAPNQIRSTRSVTLWSDTLEAIRLNAGLSLFSFVCCIPIVAFVPGLSWKARAGIGAGWGSLMLLLAVLASSSGRLAG